MKNLCEGCHSTTRINEEFIFMCNGCRSSWIHMACLYPTYGDWMCIDCQPHDPKGKQKLFDDGAGTSQTPQVHGPASTQHSVAPLPREDNPPLSCPMCEKGWVLEGNTICYSCFSGQTSDDEYDPTVVGPEAPVGNDGGVAGDGGAGGEGGEGGDGGADFDEFAPLTICNQCGVDEVYDGDFCYDCLHL